MSSVFNMLFFFWLVVMCLLSCLDEIDVRVELLADDVWEARDDKLGFLSVGVDSFNQFFLYEQQIEKYDKWILINVPDFLMVSLWKRSKNRKSEKSILMDILKFLVRPLITLEILIFCPNTESFLEQ